MQLQDRRTVIGGNELRGVLIDPVQPGATGDVRVRLDDGRTIVVPASSLSAQPDGGYALNLGTADLNARRDELVIPVVEEQLSVERQQFATDTVRIHKQVQEREEVVRGPVVREHVDIQRVPVQQLITAAPAVRYEGETMIVPVVEEVLHVEKRLMLVEEIRITRQRTEEMSEQRVMLRREEPVIDRASGAPEPAAYAPPPVAPISQHTPPVVSTPLPHVDPVTPLGSTDPLTRPRIRRNKIITED